jgi:replicative DNA helicase
VADLARVERNAEPRSLQHYDGGAEAAVLSAITLSPAALDEVRDLVEVHDFFNGQHRTLFEAVLGLDASGRTVDVVTLLHHLTTTGKLQQIGGSAFLYGILDATPSVANVAEHARIIRRLALLRRVGATLQDLAVQAKAVETRADVPGFIERCEASIFASNTMGAERETGSPISDVMAGAVQALDPARPREPRGLTTGFAELDALTLGFGPGELWYIAARPGIGKTALALGMASAVASTGARSAVMFSLEMSREDLGERMISAASGVAYKALQTRALSMADYDKAMSAANDLGRLPIFIEEMCPLTPSRLRSRARKHFAALRLKHPLSRPGIIIVDYVQLMGDDSREGNRNDQLERISRELKTLARDLRVTVVALSQLKRPPERGNQRPSLSDLRGSGALEQDADKVLFVHRAESEGDERGDAELILGKGRNAGTGSVRVTWQPWCVRFTDSAQAGFEWGPSHYDGPESDGRS